MSIKKIVRAKEQYSNLFTPKVVFVDKYEETKRDSTRWWLDKHNFRTLFLQSLKKDGVKRKKSDAIFSFYYLMVISVVGTVWLERPGCLK